MASLAKTAHNARRGLLLVVVAVVAVVAVDTIGKFLNSAANPFITIPSFYLEPTNALGAVPVPKITSLAIGRDSTPVFSIEGAFKSTPSTALVYSLVPQRITFDTVDNAKKTAGVMGFIGAYSEPQPETLRWQNQTSTRTLEVNTLTQKWTLRTQYFFDAVAQRPKTLLQNPDAYATRGKTIISQLGFSDDSFRDANMIVTYAKLGPDGLFTNPISQTSADYVVVAGQRVLDVALLKGANQLTEAQKQIANKPQDLKGRIYKQDPRQGSINMVLSNDGTKVNEDLYSLDFTGFKYNALYGVYGIVSAQEAWERVRRGEGALTLAQLQTDDYFADSRVLNVTKFAADAAQTELAYFELTEWDKFIYPIYVFRGRIETKEGQTGKFVFYVDALQRTGQTTSQ